MEIQVESSEKPVLAHVLRFRCYCSRSTHHMDITPPFGVPALLPDLTLMLRKGQGRAHPYQPIENYGVIGDLNTVALVGLDGSIDFMCFPRFDSPSIFAALLDYRKGGSFKLAPVLDGVRRKQLYFPDSNILLTRFLSADGVGEVSDFMPITEMGHAHDLVRRAKTARGELRFRMVCEPRFDYGRAEHRIERGKQEVLFISQGPDRTALRLRSEVPLKIENGAATADFTLRSGECAAFVLEDATRRGGSPSARPQYASEAFKETMNFGRVGLVVANITGAGGKW